MRDRGNKEYNNIKSIILVGQSAVLPRASKLPDANNQINFDLNSFVNNCLLIN